MVVEIIASEVLAVTHVYVRLAAISNLTFIKMYILVRFSSTTVHI